jgi:hypothetical protein
MSETREFAESIIGKTFKSRLENFAGTGEILYFKVMKAHSPLSDQKVDFAHLQTIHYVVRVPLKEHNLYQTVMFDKKNFSEDIPSDMILYSKEDFQRTFSECSAEEWNAVEEFHSEIVIKAIERLSTFVNFEDALKQPEFTID